MTIKVYIAGTDRTEWIKLHSLNISRDINGHSSCRCELEDAGRAFRPIKGHLFKVSDGGSPETIYFAGWIFRVIEKQHGGSEGPALHYSLECIDYNHVLNRRLVWAAWENKTLYHIVNHIKTHFLANEGITLNGVANPGPTITEAVEFRGETVQSVFSRLSAITGYLFYIDFTNDLQFSQFSPNPAPFNITNTTGDWKSDNLEIDRDDNDYRNRQHERSELTVDSTLLDEWTVGVAGAGSGTPPLFATTAPIVEVRQITVNDVIKTSVGIDVFDAPPGSGYDFYYLIQSYSLYALDYSPINGESVVLEYLGEALPYRPGEIQAGEGTQIVTVNDTSEQSSRISLSGGSGIWEAIEEQRNISSASALRAIGEGRLRQYGADAIKIRLTTIKDDAILEPGQRITFNVTEHNINQSFFIERCDYSWVAARTNYFECRAALTNIEPFGRAITPIQKLAEIARIGPPSKAGGAAFDDPGSTDRGGAFGPYIIRERPKGAVDGSNLTFYLTYEPEPPESLRLSAAGLIMNPVDSDDYALDGATITYTNGAQPRTGEEHYAWYFHGGVRRAAGASARYFDGVDDRLAWGNHSQLNITGALTIGIWVKFTTDDPSGGISPLILYGAGTSSEVKNDNYHLKRIGSSGAWDIRYHHEYSAGYPFNEETIDFTGANIPDDLWRFVALTRNAGSKTLKLYIGDGLSLSLNATQSYTNAPTGGSDPVCTLTVGARPATADTPAWFKGTIQEHYIWNRELTQTELDMAMRGDPPLSGLVFACPILGSSPESDTVNGWSGTITGTTIVAGH